MLPNPSCQRPRRRRPGRRDAPSRGTQPLPAPEPCRGPGHGPGGSRCAAGQAPLPARRLAGARLCTIPGFYRTGIPGPPLITSASRAEQRRSHNRGFSNQRGKVRAHSRWCHARSKASPGGRADRHQHHGHCLSLPAAGQGRLRRDGTAGAGAEPAAAVALRRRGSAVPRGTRVHLKGREGSSSRLSSQPRPRTTRVYTGRLPGSQV